MEVNAEEYDRGYVAGQKAVAIANLRNALQELGYEGTEAANARWVVERAELVQTLRDLCNDHGDNDWPDNLHLRDVIEKHLARHLDA